jgi:cytochrome c oxidase subunit 4
VASPHTPPSEAERHAEHGAGRYYVVWAILLVFTGLTVLTGRQDLGAWNIFIAMFIASIKASLVVLFFMHMSEAAGANRLVFVMSLVFVAVLMMGVFGDLWTRNPMTLPSHVPTSFGPE